MTNLRYALALAGLAALLAGPLAPPAHATQITYYAASTVASINPNAAGFPAALQGVSVGDPISFTITYDSASPTRAPLYNTLAPSTAYNLQNASVSFNINGVILDNWLSNPPTSQLTASLFNDVTYTTGPGVYDGLLFVNVEFVGQPQFSVGNILLDNTTFPNADLPTAPTISGLFLMDLGAAGTRATDPWLDSNTFTTLGPAPAVPEPASLALLALGAAGLLTRKRRPS